MRRFWTCDRLGFIPHNQGGGGGGHGTRITRDCTCTARATSFTGFFSLKYLQNLLHKSVKTACSSSDKVLIGHDSGIQEMFACGIRIQGKCLLVECEIPGFRMRHTAGGSRNSTNDWNPESEYKFHWQKNPESTAWNPESKTPIGFSYMKWHWFPSKSYTHICRISDHVKVLWLFCFVKFGHVFLNHSYKSY